MSCTGECPGDKEDLLAKWESPTGVKSFMFVDMQSCSVCQCHTPSKKAECYFYIFAALRSNIAFWASGLSTPRRNGTSLCRLSVSGKESLRRDVLKAEGHQKKALQLCAVRVQRQDSLLLEIQRLSRKQFTANPGARKTLESKWSSSSSQRAA